MKKRAFLLVLVSCFAAFMLFACDEVGTFTVTFEPNGGSPVQSVTVGAGGLIANPSTQRTGYEFGGWRKDNADGAQWLFDSDRVVSNMTLYANWIPIEYRINYSLNGGINSSLNPSFYTIEDTITLSLPTFKGSSDLFVSWHKTPDFSDAPVTSIPAGSMGDITLYAKWKGHTVTFNLGGGVGTPPAAQTVVDGEKASKPTDVVAYKDGYSTDDNWYMIIDDAYVLFSFDAAVEEDIVLTKKWTAVRYNINYVLGFGAENHADNPATYSIEERVELKDPQRDGYEFEGWLEGDGIIPVGQFGEKTFTAVWKESSTAEKFTVTFNTSGAKTTPSGFEATVEVIDGQIVNRPSGEFTKDGYKEEGVWKTAGGDVVNFDEFVITEDVTLYLQWDVVLYSIIYLNIDGAYHSNPDSYTIETATIQLDKAIKAGGEFVEWRKDDSEGQVVTQITLGSFGELSLYAVWTESQSTEDGSDENPYLISDLTDLFKIDLYDDAGIHYLQTANLVFDEGNTTIAKLLGNYDCGGFEISGITEPMFGEIAGAFYNGALEANINLPTYEKVGALAYSLKGYAGNLEIRGTIVGGYMTGGVAGSGGGVETLAKFITNYADITGTFRVGGVFGEIYLTSVENLTNYGSISGETTLGGITGYSWYGNIYNSGNNGDVIAFGEQATNIGGIVGFVDANNEPAGEKINVMYCYNKGRVEGLSYMGGIAGKMFCARILVCYNTGDVVLTEGEAVTFGGIAGATYDWGGNGCVIGESFNAGLLKKGDIVHNNNGIIGGDFESHHGVIERCSYVQASAGTIFADACTMVSYDNMKLEAFAYLMNTRVVAGFYETIETYFFFVENSLPVLYYEDAENKQIPQEGTLPDEDDGDDELGGKNNPYLINDGNDFLTLVKENPDKYFRQTASFSFEDSNNETISSFSGVYDGGGFQIGIYDPPTTGKYDNPLFWSVTGVVKNLQLQAVIRQSTYDKIGALCGELTGTAENIIIRGEILGNKQVGGLAGNAGGARLSVKNITNYAQVSGKDEVGGIFGGMYNATISDCVNYGNIFARLNPGVQEATGTNAGGIVGRIWAGGVLKSGNSGEVWGAKYVGGIVGMIDAYEPTEQFVVAGCFNRGKLIGTDYIGGIVGTAKKTKILIVYNSAVIIRSSAASLNVGGIIGYAEGGCNIGEGFNAGAMATGTNLNSTQYATNGIIGVLAEEGGWVYRLNFTQDYRDNEVTAEGKMTIEDMKDAAYPAALNAFVQDGASLFEGVTEWFVRVENAVPALWWE